jgi:hypothetical protein
MINTLTKNLMIPLLAYAGVIFADGRHIEDMSGIRGSIMLQGNLKSISPELEQFQWQIANQTNTRNDSAQGMRFFENLLFTQLGYQFNSHILISLGYVHDWIQPLNKPMYQENRPSQDFIWNDTVDDFRLVSRTRLEERIIQSTGNVGYRSRQLLQINYYLPAFNSLSLFLGDEAYFYLNKNNFGKQGFSENQVSAGICYQANNNLGVDLGYLGQYISMPLVNNLFVHNLQLNFRYRF